MLTKPRTIDNLGVDASIRYAKDTELYDKSFIDESSQVSKFTELSVITPYKPSELDELLGFKEKNHPWAKFIAPPLFERAKKNLFSFLTIPSLGSVDKQEEEKEKIKKYHKKKKRGKNFTRVEKEEEEEKNILLSLMNCIAEVDKNLSDINGRRGQYHKG